MLLLNVHTKKASREVLVPESWNELTREQLREIAGILLQESNAMRRDVQLCQAITGLSARDMGKMGAEQVAETLLPLCEWLYGENTLTRQLLPVLQTNGTPFYGPRDFLQNLRAGEFEFAERALWEWQQDQTDEKLWQFVAVLYRPAKQGYDMDQDPEGDCRMPFNGNMTRLYAMHLQRDCQRSDALAIVLFYTGCRLWMAARHPRVFGPPPAGDEAQEAGSSEPPSLYQLMRAVAKTGIYGDFEAVMHMYLYTLLAEVEASMDEAERLEEEMKNLKNG